jgi:CheY-like chemotaxis protein/two-component sensor histidine kinase
VEAGKLDVHPEEFALGSLVEDLRSVFEPLAADKRLSFSVTVAPDVPAALVTDRQRLRQVLHNLLSNAVKFTERGQVMLQIERAVETGQEPATTFSVTDTGIGISDDSLKTIFEAFQQGDGTTSRRYGGTGLGLAISREVAAQLGGRITAQSEPGNGSTFTIYLPLTAPPAAPAPLVPTLPAVPLTESASASGNGRLGGESPTGPAGPPATQSAAPDAPLTPPAAKSAQHERVRGRKVLIVDDDLRNAFANTSILELYGLRVIHAPSGRQGIDVLRSGQDIDLVLMDVMMPEMDGYTTTAAIREMPQFASLPVIAVTARAMQGDRDKSLAAGASDYVTKPVDTDELLACMERWLPPANGR